MCSREKAQAEAGANGILQAGAIGNEKSAADVIAELRAQVDKLTAENAKLSRTNEQFFSFFEALADSMTVLNDRPAASERDQLIETLLRTTSSLREHREKVATLTTERDEARKDAVEVLLSEPLGYRTEQEHCVLENFVQRCVAKIRETDDGRLDD